MPRWIAFLRAINVGGHTVKMSDLRQIFENMGYSEVETFIASGNVIFRSEGDAGVLARAIEARLQDVLGYAVATFLRTDTELAAIAAYQPFPAAQLAQAAALNVAFLAEPVDLAGVEKLATLRNEMDDFHAQGREIYWLCLKKQSDSKFSNALLERTLRRQATLRGFNTVLRMAERFPPA